MNKNNKIQPTKVYPNTNDSFFKKIYEDKAELVSLCRGLTGRDDITEADITVTTLKETNAIYVQIRNDLSFIIGADIFLVEQQSKVNPNMPVRQGSYYFNTLSELFGNAVFHSTTKKQIPRPILITFVNGNPKGISSEIIKLSDMFEPNIKDDKQGLIKIDDIYQSYIEVCVQVVYLNHPDNEKFLDTIPSLKGYAIFTQSLKHYQSKGHTKEEAVELAIDYTINQQLLVSLLLKEREGVKSMVMAQITQEEWDTFKFAEGKAEGKEEGKAEGRNEGKIEMLYKDFSFSPNEIADKLKLSLTEVERTLRALNLQ
ncbi:MAG: hypothetical protein ATN35_00410 [Epulopiscium sp. Nele67-Bin004]|nr:MAG: hypothetical protein ATN35_00410 [Epulopiscium sp. Nele67-Bin004]